MPNKTIIVSESKYPGRGLAEFVFIHDGKKYRVQPKEGAGDKLDAFLKYVKYVSPKQGVSPFAYSGWKSLFDIDRVEGTPAKPKPAEAPNPMPKKVTPEAEQLSLKLARKMELISSELHSRGLGKMAEMLKPLALRFRKAWLGPKSIGFFDDLANANIQPDDAIAILDALEGGASAGGDMTDATGLDMSVCDKVLDLAKKHLLTEE